MVVADLCSVRSELRTRSVCKAKNKNTQGGTTRPWVFSRNCWRRLAPSDHRSITNPPALYNSLHKLEIDKARDFDICRALADCFCSQPDSRTQTASLSSGSALTGFSSVILLWFVIPSGWNLPAPKGQRSLRHRSLPGAHVARRAVAGGACQSTVSWPSGWLACLSACWFCPSRT